MIELRNCTKQNAKIQIDKKTTQADEAANSKTNKINNSMKIHTNHKYTKLNNMNLQSKINENNENLNTLSHN